MKYKILHVDDEQETLDALKWYLIDEYELYQALSGKEALKISNIFYKQTGREVIREKLPEGIKDITELIVKRQ